MSGWPQDKQRARSEINGAVECVMPAGWFIAGSPAFLEFDFERSRAKPVHEPIEKPAGHVLEDRQADSHVPGKDTVARAAIDRAEQVTGRLFGLDHFDRVLVRDVRAHLRSHESRADGS